MMRILFVCHGNICRSPMAEFVMRDMVERAGLAGQVEIASAATSTEEIGNDTHPGTQRVLRRHDIPFTRRAARQIVRGDYQAFDLIVGMDRRNLINMRRAFGGDAEGKLSMLLTWTGADRDVDDPWYTGDYETTYEDVRAGCQALLEHIRGELQHQEPKGR